MDLSKMCYHFLMNVEEAKKLGHNEKTVEHYASISNSVKSFTRVKDLSWTHHREVAPLPDEKQKERLDEAVENDWSVKELKKATDKTQKFMCFVKTVSFWKI